MASWQKMWKYVGVNRLDHSHSQQTCLNYFELSLDTIGLFEQTNVCLPFELWPFAQQFDLSF